MCITGRRLGLGALQAKAPVATWATWASRGSSRRPCDSISNMPKNILFLALFLSAAGSAQNCVARTNQQLIIYRAGSLTRAFKPLEEKFTCETGIQVKDQAMGSVDAGRQITAGGQAADLYAPADYLDIDLFMKPAGYSD